MVMAMVLTGCESYHKSDKPRETYKPKYTPRNVVGVAKLPQGVRRVVVLPAYWEKDANSDFVCDLDTILHLSLQRTGAFEVVPIDREQMYKLFGVYQFSSVQILPDDLISRIAKDYAADGVLFIDLTQNRPYRPIALGIRAKLVEVKTMQIIWSIDCLFDSADPAVAGAALDFSKRSTYNSRMPVDSTGEILMSPRAYAGFVMDTIFGTLPPR